MHGHTPQCHVQVIVFQTVVFLTTSSRISPIIGYYTVEILSSISPIAGYYTVEFLSSISPIAGYHTEKYEFNKHEIKP